MIKSNKLVLHFIIPLEVRYSIYLQNYAWHVCSNLSHTRGRLTLSREVLETITLGRDSVCRWQRLQNWGGGAWERFHLRTRQKYLATKSFRIYWLRCIYNLKQLLFTRWSVCVCGGGRFHKECHLLWYTNRADLFTRTSNNCIFCRTLPFSLTRIELAQNFTLDLRII